jgi:hypothetical protein
MQLVLEPHRLGGARRRQARVADRAVDAHQPVKILLRGGPIEEHVCDMPMPIEQRPEVVGDHAFPLDRGIETPGPTA